jgi:hypothetical protein
MLEVIQDTESLVRERLEARKRRTQLLAPSMTCGAGLSVQGRAHSMENWTAASAVEGL